MTNAESETKANIYTDHYPLIVTACLRLKTKVRGKRRRKPKTQQMLRGIMDATKTQQMRKDTTNAQKLTQRRQL